MIVAVFETCDNPPPKTASIQSLDPINHTLRDA